jgi:hypothetical protein
MSSYLDTSEHFLYFPAKDTLWGIDKIKVLDIRRHLVLKKTDKLFVSLTTILYLQGENEIVFRAVQVLYTDGNPVVKTNLAKIVLSGVRALAEKKPEEKAVNVVSYINKPKSAVAVDCCHSLLL